MIGEAILVDRQDQKSSDTMPIEDHQYCFIIASRTGAARKLSETVLRPAVEGAGFFAISADDVKLGEQLASAIWSAIKNADLILANISGSNPNVLYELGIAQGMGKRTIIVTDDYSNVPSDLSHMHIIRFQDSSEGLKSLRKSIHNTLVTIRSEQRWSEGSVNQPSQIDQKEGEEIARKEISRAIKSRKSGRLEEAIRLLENSLAILRRSKPSTLHAEAYNLLGTTYQQVGSYEKARRNLEEAAEILKRSDDPEAEASVYINLANVFEAQGELQRAEDFYRRAIEVARQVDSKTLLASGLSNLGYLASQMGDLQKAESLFQEALGVQAQFLGQDHPTYSSTLSNLAAVYEHSGRLDEAESALRQAIEISERHGDQYGYARTLHNIASLLIDRGDFEQAESSLRRSMEIKDRLGDRSGRAASLFNLAKVAEARGAIAEAATTLRQAAEIQESLGDRRGLARTWGALADISIKAGDRDAAKRFLERAFNTSEELGAPDRDVIAAKISDLSSRSASESG